MMMMIPTTARRMPNSSEDPGGVLPEGLGGVADATQDALGAVLDAPGVVIDEQREGVQHEGVHGEVAGLRIGLAGAAPTRSVLLCWQCPCRPVRALHHRFWVWEAT